jgi:formylglycine-generating enzyme required for sulfatase activity
MLPPWNGTRIPPDRTFEMYLHCHKKPMSHSRRTFLKAAILAGGSMWTPWWSIHSLAGSTAAASFAFEPDKDIIPAPEDPKDWPSFRMELQRWREAARRRLHYSDALYANPAFSWSASSFACCFLMMCDETFYDARRRRYRVEEFLAHGRQEFGGYDSLVLWHAYPRIGVDDRNQFDFYRDMPGGLKGLRKTVERIRRSGTRVYIDYNPWDTGTRREGKSDIDALIELVAALQVDGIFLDTMSRGAAELRTGLDGVRPGVILEGEAALPLDRLHDHHASWAQHFDDSHVPGVLRNKWIERRHMQHQIRRWNEDHNSEIQTAWMNGSGMMVWENVFGSWVGWCARDRSLLRTILPIQRKYATLLSGERWTPLVPTESKDLYASLWEGDGLRLWTLINRAENERRGVRLRADRLPCEKYFDLVGGQELQPRHEGEQVVFEAFVPARGVGCFLAANGKHLGADFRHFLAHQAATLRRASLDTTPPARVTRLTPVARTRRAAVVPEGMVEVPAVDMELVIEMRNRECGFYESTPPQDQNFWNSYQFTTRAFRRKVRFDRFAIDRTLVTNGQFYEFLRRAKCRPRRSENFLKHWYNGQPPLGKDDHPVVYVDLDDARAYARWAGKRLPTEEEWQYAAQGNDQRKYPWGAELRGGLFNGGEAGGTTPVTAYPESRSPFGCYDMCGNVWQWTESERTDGRTRFCIIRGGSYFTARGSNWYVDGGPRPVNFATKFLLMWPGLDRCATIGFRCVKDLV